MATVGQLRPARFHEIFRWATRKTTAARAAAATPRPRSRMTTMRAIAATTRTTGRWARSPTDHYRRDRPLRQLCQRPVDRMGPAARPRRRCSPPWVWGGGGDPTARTSCSLRAINALTLRYPTHHMLQPNERYMNIHWRRERTEPAAGSTILHRLRHQVRSGVGGSPSPAGFCSSLARSLHPAGQLYHNRESSIQHSKVDSTRRNQYLISVQTSPT